MTLYQPCYDLRTGDLVAVEALARLRDPETGGLIGPDRFLDTAERSGLVTRLDEMMLTAAARQVARWRELPAGRRLCVAINVSPADLDDPGLVDGIVRITGEAGLPLDALIIELTETLLSRTGRGHEQVLAQLSDLHCNVTLDDFGTGYASFAYLQRFKVDGIKLDRSFVQQLGAGGPHERLAESLLRFCLSLGVHVVAEGIEEERQLEALRRLGCPFGQGYLMSVPVPAAELERLLLDAAGRAAALERSAATPSRRPLAPRSTAPRRHYADRVASRVLAGLVALAVVGITVLSLTGKQASDESLAHAAQNRLVAIDSLAAGQVGLRLGGLHDVLTTFSRSESAQDAITSRDREAMESTVDALGSVTAGTFTSALYDARGTLLAIRPALPDLVGRNFAYRDWYAGARASHEAYISRAFQLATPGAPWAVAVASAIRNDKGRPVGYVVASLTLATLQTQVDDVLAEQGVAMTMADGHGTVLAAPGGHGVGATTDDPRLRPGSPSAGDASDDTQWAVRPIPAVGGRLLAEQSRSTALGSVESQGRLGLAMLLLLAVVGLLLVLVWLRTDARRRRLETELGEAHDWATTIMTATPTPFVVCDRDDRIQLANPAFADLLGVDDAALQGQLLSSWVPTRDQPATAGGVYHGTVVTSEGDVRIVDVRTEVLGESDGEPVLLHALVDVTPHREEQDRLRAQSRTDPLTGLGNRVALREALATALAGHGAPHGLLMMDLDGFKAVNDSLGHDVGDELLCLVADVLRAAVPPRDLVARMGGDEFVTLTRLDDERQLDEVAGQLREKVESALARHDSAAQVRVGISVGAALVGTDGTELRDLLRAADLRMYEAKRDGRRLRR